MYTSERSQVVDIKAWATCETTLLNIKLQATEKKVSFLEGSINNERLTMEYPWNKLSKQNDDPSYQRKDQSYSQFCKGLQTTYKVGFEKCKALVKELFFDINFDLLELLALDASELAMVDVAALIAKVSSS